MATSKVSPLAFNAPIVDPITGNPTSYFVRQLKQLLEETRTANDLAEGAVPNSRLINTTSPITGGGDLTADLTIALDSSTLNESIQDMLNTFLVAGSNITLTYDDGSNTLTIASSGGGGGALSLIEKKTFTGSETSFTFSSIPQTYTSLEMVVFGRVGVTANSILALTVNGLTTAIYDRQRQFAISTTNSADEALAQTNFQFAALPGTTYPAAQVGHGIVKILGYSQTSFEKNFDADVRWVGTSTTTHNGYQMRITGAVRTTNAVTSIEVTPTSAGATFSAGSFAALYGRS